MNVNGTAWLILLAVVAILVGPFVTLKALARFRSRGGKLPPAQPYKDDDD